MEREIEFRGKTISGEWVYGLLSIISKKVANVEPGYYISNSKGIPFAYQVIPETVGQFTGLKDKNKKKIYDGDIIQHGYITYQYVIQYIGCSFMCCKRIGEVSFSLFEANLHEVIGNIHDNPELLQF